MLIPNGKPAKIKRRFSFTGTVEELKKINAVSSGKLDSPEKPKSGSPGTRDRIGSATRLSLERQGTIVSKGIRSLGDEEVSKKIEKAWREKDFAYLREFLSQKTSVERYGTENSHEKKDTEHLKTMGDEEKGPEDVKSAKKKKKKRNPNINASSGSVVTTTRLKAKKGEDEPQRTAREEIIEDRLIYEDKEESDEEQLQPKQGNDKDRIANLIKKKSQEVKHLEGKKLDLLHHPTKENVHKKINYKFHQAGTPMAKNDNEEKFSEIKSNPASNSASQTQQNFMPGQHDKSQTASDAGADQQKDKTQYLSAFSQGNVANGAKIHQRNKSFRAREQLIEKLTGGNKDPEPKPQETSASAKKKHKPQIKSKYDLGKIDAFTVGDETKTITFGADDGSLLKTKKTEEHPSSDDKSGLDSKIDPSRKLLDIMEKMDSSKVDTKFSGDSLDVEIPVRRAVTVRKQENIDLLAHIQDMKEKKPSRFNKLTPDFRAASFTEKRKNPQLLVKGEDKNPDSDDSTRKGSARGGRSGFASPENPPTKKGKGKASRFAAKEAKEKEKNNEDDDYVNGSSGSGREDLYGSDDFFPSSGDPTKMMIGSDEPKTIDDKTRTDFVDSAMPSIAEKLDKVPKLAKTRSKKSMKKKNTTGAKGTTSTEESKDPHKDEKASPEGETIDKLEEQLAEEAAEVGPLSPSKANGASPDGAFGIEKQRSLRHNFKQRGLSQANVEDILDDPLKLFQAVLNDGEVDQETKLDLFFYGNRKEALKEFVKEIEDTIEHNIIKNGECSEMLADFFDAKMNSLLVSKAPLIKQGKGGNQFARKYTFPHNVANYDYDDLSESFMNQKSSQENEAENSRRIAFQFQQTLLNNMRASASSYCTPLSQANIGPKSKKGQIILSPSAFETLVQRKDEILLDQFAHQKDEDMAQKTMKEEREEADLLSRLERLRKLLIQLRESDPEEFARLLLLFKENRKLYHIIMKEVDARDKAKKNILI